MATMTLRNFGGFYQLVVETEADLKALDSLDPARWGATSAPLRDLHCDPAFLAFVDTAGTGRIRVQELLAARNWLFDRMKTRRRTEERTDELLIGDIDTAHPDGAKLRHAAEHVVKELKLSDVTRLKLADVRAYRSGYTRMLANGDGVVPPALLPDADVADFAREVMSVVGSAPDASGEKGVGEAQLLRFVEGGKAFLQWKAKPAQSPEIVPLGPDTEAAVAAVRALDAKIEEYFLVCDLLRQDKQAETLLRPTDDEMKSMRTKGAQGIESCLASAPLAHPNAAGELSVTATVNPAFQAAWSALSDKVLSRMVKGQGTIDRVSWRRVKAAFDPY